MKEEKPIILFERKQSPVNPATLGDCACGTVELQFQTATPLSERYDGQTSLWTLPELRWIPIDTKFSLAYSPFLPARSAVLNQAAITALESFATGRQPCTDENDLVQNFLETGLLYSPAEDPHSQPAPFVAWLHLTGRCNLACDYCYAPISHHTMSIATGQQAVRMVFQLAKERQASKIRLKFAGGEPLLNFNTMVAAHVYAGQLALANQQDVESILITNGTLINPVHIDWLVANNVQVVVSMDGIEGAHDIQRHYKNHRRGSFGEVQHAIQSLIEAGCAPHVIITVTGRNVGKLTETITWLRQRNLSFAINFYRRHTGSDQQPDLELDEDTLIAELTRAFKQVDWSDCPYPLLNSLLDRVNLISPHQKPCGAGEGFLVVTPEGQLAACQMDIDHASGSVYDPMPERSFQRVTSHFANPAVDEKEDCASCPWKLACAGGCPDLTRRLTNNPYGPSTFCRVYRELIPEVLKLEGQRLLNRAVKYGMLEATD